MIFLFTFDSVQDSSIGALLLGKRFVCWLFGFGGCERRASRLRWHVWGELSLAPPSSLNRATQAAKALTRYGFSGSKITDQGLSKVLQAAFVYVPCIRVPSIYKIKLSCLLHHLRRLYQVTCIKSPATNWPANKQYADWSNVAVAAFLNVVKITRLAATVWLKTSSLEISDSSEK